MAAYSIRLSVAQAKLRYDNACACVAFTFLSRARVLRQSVLAAAVPLISEFCVWFWQPIRIRNQGFSQASYEVAGRPGKSKKDGQEDQVRGTKRL